MSRKPQPEDDPFGPRWVGIGGPPDMNDEEAKAKFKAYHKASGSMGTYYMAYPKETPKGFWDKDERREKVSAKEAYRAATSEEAARESYWAAKDIPSGPERTEGPAKDRGGRGGR